MQFSIRLGIPEIEKHWNELNQKKAAGTINANDESLRLKWGKAMALLANNPRHPGLNSHEIEALTSRYHKKVWQSYLENRKPSAGRLYWVYGPAKGEITIIGLEPHPEDKKRGGYQKVRLSEMGEVESRSNPPKTDI